jgi:uncharacterized repeat protein (TIGR02543 family)
MRRIFFVFGILWFALSRLAFATSQLIVNGGFESTSAFPWVLEGAGAQVVSGTGAYDGSQYLSMGNGFGPNQYVYQAVTFPTNLIGATLSLANETFNNGDPNGDDFLSIWLAQGSGTSFTYLQQIGGTASSANPNNGWAYGSINFINYAGSNILSSYAGETVDLLFLAQLDPLYGNLAQFNIDDVSLVVGTTADIPSNDDFTNAAVISPNGITNIITTTYASRENLEPEINGNPGGHSLWWTWTAPAIGTVSISTSDNNFTTLLGVYTGSSISNLTVVTNYNGMRSGTGATHVTFPVSLGTQYQISVDGYDGQSGTAVFALAFTSDKTLPTVKINPPPAGGDVSSSTVLVQGTASDNVAVAAVYCQLVNADGTNAWQLATGTNTWSATITDLIPGANTIRAEAIDTSSNVSKIASVVYNYFISVPLTLNKVGEGTVSGATNGQLLHLGYPYTLTATAAAGFAFTGWTGDITTNSRTLKFSMSSNLSLTANFVDVEKPTLSITAPLSRQRWSNSVFNVTGKAKDNVGVASVWYQVNTAPWANNVNTSNGYTNWNVSVTLPPGTNTIRSYAEDAAGNISITNSVSFVYVLSATLAVQTNGLGTLKPNYNNALLQISNTYTMTATASQGYVFSNWTSSAGAVVTNGPTLKFIMASNLDFTANFVPNPFIAVAGTYDGLFYDTNSDAATPANSGFFSATIKNTGSFTASFQHANKNYPISGQLSLTGGWSGDASVAGVKTAITLQLDMTGGNVLEGDLTNPVWAAELAADRSVFSTAKPAPQEGLYTIIFPGANSMTLPGGNGFGTVSVNASGTVTLGGVLGDGTKVTQSATESGQGQWPLYISLDSGNGMLLGWLTFTNETDRDIDGELTWIKPSTPATTLFPAGFTNVLEAAGSAYSLPKGALVLDLTNGYVLLEGGGLLQSISNQFALGANNVVTGSNKLSLTITTTTGLFKGTTTNSGGATVTFNGAVFQKQTNGFGQFLGAGQTGSVYVAPQ